MYFQSGVNKNKLELYISHKKYIEKLLSTEKQESFLHVFDIIYWLNNKIK